MNEIKQQLWIIRLVIFVAFMAMTLPYSIMPELIINNVVTTPTLLSDFKPETTILILMGIYSLGMLFGSYILGRLSDRFGKRKTLLYSLL